MIPKEKLVLYVDDTEEQRYAMRRILERGGYRVLEAGTGREALAQLQPELMLVIVDVRLPDMSGYDVCRSIKADPRCGSVPVIQVSASYADPERRAAGLSGGADAYIAQPVHPQELLNLASSLIRSSETEGMLAFLAGIGTQISRSLDLQTTLAAVQTAPLPYFADRVFLTLQNTVAEPFSTEPDDPGLQELAAEVIAKDASSTLTGSIGVYAIGAPLHAGGTLLGAVLFVLESSKRVYSPRDQVYAEDLADRFAMAIQNARLFTAQQTAQAALVQSEKLAAAARLTAAIAHELNNPLASVINLVYLIETSANDAQAVTTYAKEALSELERLSHMTRQTLGFYRELTMPRQFDLSETVDDTLHLYQRRLDQKGVEVTMELTPGLLVHAVQGEIRQVISNILVNALDAVPQHGRVSVQTGRTAAGEIHVLVRDNGPGIPPQILPRIFEAFFTTKPGTGTGLGLWVSDTIMRKHDGRLEVHSTSDGETGTEFRMILPPA